MTSSDSAAPPQSRTAYVVSRLRSELEAGAFAPGEQLRQVSIAERYGVSPTPVREAFRILASDGTIEYTIHRGATVRDYSPEMARDLYRLRAEVEALAVSVAVERMTPETLERVMAADAALEAAVAAGDPPERLSLLNRALHFAIYEGSSSVIAESIEQLWTRFQPNITLWGVHSFATALAHDHRDILAAIADGDGDRASALMRKHVLRAFDLRQTDRELRASGSDG